LRQRKKNDEEACSGIVNDFGLNDGIESGLVKTPRVVVRDDGTPDAVHLPFQAVPHLCG
jgi:type III restriction enzyme